MRKHTRRRVITPLPPIGLRPRLAPDQVRDLSLLHNISLDAIARGEADAGVLEDWAGAVLTWSRVAELREIGMAEMHGQLDLATRVLERYRDTGHATFEPGEYDLARLGVMAMDELAKLVDRPTAIAAANWSELRLNEMARQGRFGAGRPPP